MIHYNYTTCTIIQVDANYYVIPTLTRPAISAVQFTPDTAIVARTFTADGLTPDHSCRPELAYRVKVIVVVRVLALGRRVIR